MTIENPEEKRFMEELHAMTGGDIAVLVSMYEVGASLGLEKKNASTMAEELIWREWVELRSLAGGISITGKGLTALGLGEGEAAAMRPLSLGGEEVATEEDLALIKQMLADIKACLSHSESPYPRLEEMVIDIKTVETQLLSPRPKTAVIREIFLSLAQSASTIGQTDLAARLKALGSQAP